MYKRRPFDKKAKRNTFTSQVYIDMKNLLLPILGALFCHVLPAQTPYISYMTGDPADVAATPRGGIVLMGGAGEMDNAMRWFLEQSGGGDILVLRASGADGYNDYLYDELGESVNSVETIVTPSQAAADHPYVVQQIYHAEALWIAGGDQANYVDFWKDGPVEDAIRYLIHVKKAPVGGLSAGMAIQGDAYFSAMNGTVLSAEALADPYAPEMTIGYGDFLDHPILKDVITDTHYDDPDRRGRHLAFLGRLAEDHGIRAKGIACEEYVAVCIDTLGIAHVYGNYPNEPDYAWFVQTNCAGDDFTPETCQPGQPLNWVRNNAAVLALRVSARPDGANTFDLNDWETFSGTDPSYWTNWYSADGTFTAIWPGTEPDCATAAPEPVETPTLRLWPVPADEVLYTALEGLEGPADLVVADMLGRLVLQTTVVDGRGEINVGGLEKGVYAVMTRGWKGGMYTLPFVVK